MDEKAVRKMLGSTSSTPEAIPLVRTRCTTRTPCWSFPSQASASSEWSTRLAREM
jgi:hypothetical protein